MQNSALDKAIATYRENPTERNKQALLAAQTQHIHNFHASQSESYIRRTK